MSMYTEDDLAARKVSSLFGLMLINFFLCASAETLTLRAIFAKQYFIETIEYCMLVYFLFSGELEVNDLFFPPDTEI